MPKKPSQDSPAPTATIEAPTDVQAQPTQGSSAKLFPELFETAPEPAPVLDPVSPVEPGKEVPSPVETPAPAPEPTPAPEPSDVLDIAAFQGKKVRVKVDGEEMEVPAESLLKNFQLEAHLTRKGQMLAEQRKTLEELKNQLLEKQTKTTTEIETAIEEGETPSEIKLLRQELEQTKAQLAEVNQVTSDIRFQRAVERLDSQVRNNLGFDDFKSYVPKIQQFIASQLQDPKNPTPQEIAQFDNANFYLAKYQEMKLRDFKAQMSAPKAPAPAAVPATPPAPKLTQIVNVEPAGGGIPQKTDTALEQKIQAAFSRAKETGDWAEYIALKHSSQ